MKFISIIFLIVSVVTSCTSPNSTARDFLVALNQKQFETATDLVTEASKPILYELIHQETQEMPEVQIKIENCAAAEENDKHVICLYSINNQGERFEKRIHLIKENNQWKIDLTQKVN
ncbi:MAG: DUF4878 domain-containing protein [Flavobacteriaceae bacterium]|nr:DUF4878 domain-containing protein [Flavobacteriaceae bacterium]